MNGHSHIKRNRGQSVARYFAHFVHPFFTESIGTKDVNIQSLSTLGINGEVLLRFIKSGKITLIIRASHR